MSSFRRRALWRLAPALAVALLVGCAAPPPVATPGPEAATLAPTGVLRVGVYLGSPTSLVRDAAGQPRGVSVELGQAFAQRLGVPFRMVEFPRLALVLDALKAGEVDFTVTNATAARAQEMNFSPPVVGLELGLLVPPGSPIASVEQMDRPGQRIGVAQGSSSQGSLGRTLKAATIVATPTLQVAAAQLSAGELQGFATNKAILFELAGNVPGARVLDGRWGLEHLAIAIPKGREAGMDLVRRFAEQAIASGQVKQAADRAQLRGMAQETAR